MLALTLMSFTQVSCGDSHEPAPQVQSNGGGSQPIVAPSPSPNVSPSPTPIRVKSGHWGGLDATADVTIALSKFQFDCAHGRVLGPLLLNSAGHFFRNGTITLEGGPEPIHDRPSIPATYTGTVNGEKMNLEVRYMQGNHATVSNFTLTFGVPGELHRCL